METTPQTWSQLSAQDFAALGLNQVAYIQAVENDTGKRAYVVRAANGTDIAEMADLKIAVAAVRQHEMEPLSVH